MELQQLIAQRDALDAQIREARASKRAEALADVRKIIAEFELTPADLGIKSGRSPRTSLVAPKFRGPNGETWAGRGRKPRWLDDALAAGRKIEEFAI